MPWWSSARPPAMGRCPGDLSTNCGASSLNTRSSTSGTAMHLPAASAATPTSPSRRPYPKICCPSLTRLRWVQAPAAGVGAPAVSGSLSRAASSSPARAASAPGDRRTRDGRHLALATPAPRGAAHARLHTSGRSTKFRDTGRIITLHGPPHGHRRPRLDRPEVARWPRRSACASPAFAGAWTGHRRPVSNVCWRRTQLTDLLGRQRRHRAVDAADRRHRALDRRGARSSACKPGALLVNVGRGETRSTTTH